MRVERRSKRAAIAWALLLVPAVLWGQPRSMRFARLSIPEGLSAATVNGIFQDSTGFVWVGTQEGLNRYDGVEFVHYKNDPDDPASLSNNWIRALLEHPSGDIWIATRGGGLNRWRRATDDFEHLRHDPSDPQSLSDDSQRALVLDRHGFLWIGTEDSGLDRYDPATGTFEHFRHDPTDPDSLTDDQIRGLYEDSEGRIWVGTFSGGLNVLDPETGKFRRFRHDPEDPTSLNDDLVRAVLEDRAGEIWVGTHGGLARVDTETWTFERFAHDPGDPTSLSGNRVRVLWEETNGRFWVGTDSGLNLLDRETGRFLHYRYDPADGTSLGNDRVSSLFQSSSGLLWVGTQDGGVNKWDPRSWSFANDPMRPSGLSNTSVLALSLDGQGHLWIGTSGGGVNRLNRQTGEMTTFRHDPLDPTSVSSDQVTALFPNRDGAIWVGTLSAGLDRFDPATGLFTHFDDLGDSGVMTIFEDRQGRLWLGRFGDGIDMFDPASGRFRNWRHDPDDPRSLSDDRVTSFAETADGRLWVGTLSKGLNLFDPETGDCSRFNHDVEDPASLSSDTVLSVYVDHADQLWVSTQAGLNRLDRLDGATGEVVFRRFTKSDGLPNDFVYAVLADDAGNLWVSSNGGLSRLDPETETFVNFDASHGLQSDEFNMNSRFRGPDGELFFGGVSGYNAFYPARLRSNTTVPPVVLTEFSKQNRPVRFAGPVFDVDEITLDHTENVFSFQFAALDFTAPEKNRYRYRLEGFDEDWIDHGNRRRVTFTNLDPGDYVLRVQGSNSDGVWNEQGLSVRVHVTPPYWQTWWFQALAVVAAASLVFLIFHLRTRNIRKINEQLERLVGERTRELAEAQDQLLRRERLATLGELAGSVAHELRNPLGVIKNSVYFLRLTQKGDDKAQGHLRMIEREIGRSNRIITELLDFGRNPTLEISRVRPRRVIEGVLRAAEIPDEIRVVWPEGGCPTEVEADLGQVERILENLVRNAVQAMPDGGELRIECRVVGAEAQLEVADDGIGISEDDLAKVFEPLYTTKTTGIGLGLALCQRYAHLNGGRIECESVVGQGATFRLILPLAPAEG